MLRGGRIEKCIGITQSTFDSYDEDEWRAKTKSKEIKSSSVYQKERLHRVAPYAKRAVEYPPQGGAAAAPEPWCRGCRGSVEGVSRVCRGSVEGLSRVCRGLGVQGV